jgi:copper chaperone
MIQSISLKVTGMKCGGCENNVTSKLMALEGVKTATASSKDNVVTVEFDANSTSLKEIAQTIEDAGYKVVDGNF